MVKRERENPCFICGHYHRYEEGETCGICGCVERSDARAPHPLRPPPARVPSSSSSRPDPRPLPTLPPARHRPPRPGDAKPPSRLPSEILPDFLYLGSYDHSARAETLRHFGIASCLNCVGPACANLHRSAFAYHTVAPDPPGDPAAAPPSAPPGADALFEESFAFLESERAANRRCLAFCMSGASKSPSVVVAYLMRRNEWRLAEAYRFVKERRPEVSLKPDAAARLGRFERALFGEEAEDAGAAGT